MLKFVIILLLSTGALSLLDEEKSDDVLQPEIKTDEVVQNTVPDVQTEVNSDELYQNTVPNEQSQEKIDGLDQNIPPTVPDTPAEKIGVNVKPENPARKPKRTTMLDMEQINMLAEKVIRIHGVDLESSDDENMNNIAQLRNLVANMEKDVTKKLKLSQQKKKLNVQATVNNNEQPAATETVKTQNGNDAKKNIVAEHADVVNIKVPETESKTSENIPEAEVKNSKVEIQKDVTGEVATDENGEVKIKIDNEAINENVETIVVEEVSTKNEPNIIVKKLDKESTTENKEEVPNIQLDGNEPIVHSKEDTSDSTTESQKETVEISQNEESVNSELNNDITEDQNDGSNVDEGGVEVQIEEVTKGNDGEIEATDTYEYVSEVPNEETVVPEFNTATESSELNQNASEGQNNEETEDQNGEEDIKDEDDETEITNTNEGVSETIHEEAVEENINVNDIKEDETIGVCGLGEDCDQKDNVIHKYTEEYNSENIAEEKLQSKIEDSYLQSIVKYIVSIWN